MNNKNSTAGLTCFILGAAAGSIAALFFATREGKVFRRILKNDTNLLWENSVEKGRAVFSSAENNVKHYFNRAVRLLNREFISISAGIFAAKNYIRRNKTPDKLIEDITEDFIFENTDFDYDSDYLPKYEGMKKRVARKRFK